MDTETKYLNLQLTNINTLWKREEIVNVIRADLRSLPYEVCDLIGEGSFSFVCRARHTILGEDVALKVVKKIPRLAECLPVEIKCWKALDHPKIIKLIEVIDTIDHVIFVSEYFRGKDLYHILSHECSSLLPERTVRKIFADLVEAVDYCHSKGYAHRDIKLENILWSGSEIKLIDFGLAIPFELGRSRRFSGTPHYSPPEIFLHLPYDPLLADVWSLGVVLYTMLLGKLPFAGTSSNDISELVVSSDFDSSSLDQVPPLAKDLILKMLKGEPYERVDMTAIKEHDWVRLKDVKVRDSLRLPSWLKKFKSKLANQNSSLYSQIDP